MSWWWRTKPRSILRTIQWFPFFGSLENTNWDEEDPNNKSKMDGKAVHPVRRSYIYNAHSDEDTFMSSLSFQKYCSGKYDIKETESNGRNDKTTFEFFGFGYVEKNGTIKVTEAGRRIMQGTFDDEDFLKQLLKLQFPNNIQSRVKGFTEEDFVYPMELVCKLIKKYGFLNRSEVVLLFGCKHIDEIDKTYSAIEYFRLNIKIMNKSRRKALSEIAEALRVQKDRLESIMDEEQEAYDNMPEGLQESERGEQMDEYISTIDSSMDDMESVIENLEEIAEG